MHLGDKVLRAAYIQVYMHAHTQKHTHGRGHGRLFTTILRIGGTMTKLCVMLMTNSPPCMAAAWQHIASMVAGGGYSTPHC